MSESRLKILFVDNEEESCISFKAIFRRDYDIFITTEPLEVSALIEQNDINIILSDYTMPKINGTHLLEFVRRQYPEVRRILVTGSIDVALKNTILNEKTIEALISKPWIKPDLHAAIENIYYLR